jgi:hypothetical protein
VRHRPHVNREGLLVSEQMAQQVDITLRPGLLPGCFHHHGTGICPPGNPQRGVIVDLHPVAAGHREVGKCGGSLK